MDMNVIRELRDQYDKLEADVKAAEESLTPVNRAELVSGDDYRIVATEPES